MERVYFTLSVFYIYGHVIRISGRTWGSNIDESVEVGKLVTVIGKIDFSWAEYYGCIYAETCELIYF